MSLPRVQARVLAGVLLLCLSAAAPGQEKSGEALAAPAVERGATLTVVVTGAEKAIADAEVMVIAPEGAAGSPRLLTDSSGEATFASAGAGNVSVRVVAAGWQTILKEIALQQGAQRERIELVPLNKEQ